MWFGVVSDVPGGAFKGCRVLSGTGFCVANEREGATGLAGFAQVIRKIHGSETALVCGLLFLPVFLLIAGLGATISLGYAIAMLRVPIVELSSQDVAPVEISLSSRANLIPASGLASDRDSTRVPPVPLVPAIVGSSIEARSVISDGGPLIELAVSSVRFGELDAVSDIGPVALISDVERLRVGVAKAGTRLAVLAASDAARGALPVREANACFVGHQNHPDEAVIASEALEFGQRLAHAALRQTRDFVFYVDRYIPISYPGGDVPALYGVCTDVVVRAYRQMGIDLQSAVYEARLGTRDPSIDHRRVSVLRRYFARYGESIPVGGLLENFRPGDIVTYYRPRNRGARDHIAIVSDRIGPSGAPMIIHNQGRGVELDDALFADPITGHFRYRGKADMQVAGHEADVDVTSRQ